MMMMLCLPSTPSWLGLTPFCHFLHSLPLCFSLCLWQARQMRRSAAKIYMHVRKLQIQCSALSLSLSLSRSPSLSWRIRSRKKAGGSPSPCCVVGAGSSRGLPLYLSRLITKFALNHNFQCFTRHPCSAAGREREKQEGRGEGELKLP